MFGFPNMAEAAVVDKFNRHSRFEQLNVLAMALNELGHNPILQGELWHEVRNPFLSVYERHIASIYKRIASRHGIVISLPAKPFRMTDWGISDG